MLFSIYLQISGNMPCKINSIIYDYNENYDSSTIQHEIVHAIQFLILMVID